MTPPTAATELPTHLGPYLLGPVVGVGATAVVVRARDTRTDADVAIKLLRVADPAIGARFLRECRLLRRVAHPSLLGVRDLGETPAAGPYLVMDLARDSLADRLRSAGAPADAPTLGAVVSALAAGLGALHRAGIVHRNVKPENLLLVAESWTSTTWRPGTVVDEDERIVIGDLGVAEGGAHAGEAPGSSGDYRAPEQRIPGRPIDPRADVYAATAVLWALIVGRTPPGRSSALSVEVQTVSSEWREFFRAGMAADPANRHPDMTAWAAAALQAIRVAAAEAAARRPAVIPVPYKGLAPYQPEDAPLYFGRSELADSLVACLAKHPVLVIAGASGSGKSSLVRAGLVPRLEAGALPNSATWATCLFTPGDRPLHVLAEQLTAAGAVEVSADSLRANPAAVREALPRPVLLVVDQFEELFTLGADEGEQEAFLHVLAALSAPPAPRARVVLAVRADFYAACAARPWLAAAVNSNQVLVEPMGPGELRAAVEGPAARLGLQLDDGLVDRLLTDAGAQPAALPMLAHALAQTWHRREGDVLTLAGYEAAGGTSAAIERTAEGVWAGLVERDLIVARRLLLRMVAQGDGIPDTRRVLAWTDLTSDQRHLLGLFVEAGLLTLDVDGLRFAHEAVLRSWSRLMGWMVESREELRVGAHMELAATQWERQGRHPDLLLQGVALAAALDWRDRQHGDVAFQVASFLAEAESMAAEAQAAQDRAERRAARGRRRVLVGFGAVAAVAVFAAGAGLDSIRSSEDVQAVGGEGAPVAPANAAVLAAAAQNFVATNPSLAATLALEALAGGQGSGAARDALVRARIALAGDRPVPVGEPISAPGGRSLAVRPAGDLAAVGRNDGSVDLYDLAAGTKVAAFTGPRGAVQSIAFTADGTRLVAGSTGGTIWAWDLSGTDRATAPGLEIAAPGAAVGAIAAAPTGSQVAASTDDGSVWLLDAVAGVVVGEPLRTQADELDAVTFAGPDTVLAGTGGGRVLAWRPRDGLRWSTRAHDTGILDMTVCQTCSPRMLATVSSAGNARLLEVETGTFRDRGSIDVPSGVRGVTFASDGSSLTLGGPDGALYTWRPDGSAAQPSPLHSARVARLAATGDGRTLVSLADDATLQVWSNVPRPDAVARIAELANSGGVLARSADASTLAVGLADGTVHLLDAATGTEQTVLRAPSSTTGGSAIGAVVFLGSDRVLAGDAAGTLRVWPAAGGKPLVERVEAHRGAVGGLAVAGDGVLSIGTDGAVRLWPSDLTQPRRAVQIGGELTDVATDATASTVAVVGRSGVVTQWSPASGATRQVAALGDTVSGATLAGNLLVVARADGALSAWDLGAQNAGPVWERATNASGPQDVALAAPGILAVASGDGRLRLFDAATGAPIGTPLAAGPSGLRQIAAGPDGTLWTVDRDGRVFRTDVLSPAAACAALGPERRVPGC